MPSWSDLPKLQGGGPKYAPLSANGEGGGDVWNGATNSGNGDPTNASWEDITSAAPSYDPMAPTSQEEAEYAKRVDETIEKANDPFRDQAILAAQIQWAINGATEDLEKVSEEAADKYDALGKDEKNSFFEDIYQENAQKEAEQGLQDALRDYEKSTQEMNKLIEDYRREETAKEKGWSIPSFEAMNKSATSNPFGNVAGPSPNATSDNPFDQFVGKTEDKTLTNLFKMSPTELKNSTDNTLADVYKDQAKEQEAIFNDESQDPYTRLMALGKASDLEQQAQGYQDRIQSRTEADLWSKVSKTDTYAKYQAAKTDYEDTKKLLEQATDPSDKKELETQLFYQSKNLNSAYEQLKDSAQKNYGLDIANMSSNSTQQTDDSEKKIFSSENFFNQTIPGISPDKTVYVYGTLADGTLYKKHEISWFSAQGNSSLNQGDNHVIYTIENKSKLEDAIRTNTSTVLGEKFEDGAYVQIKSEGNQTFQIHIDDKTGEVSYSRVYIDNSPMFDKIIADNRAEVQKEQELYEKAAKVLGKDGFSELMDAFSKQRGMATSTEQEIGIRRNQINSLESLFQREDPKAALETYAKVVSKSADNYRDARFLSNAIQSAEDKPLFSHTYEALAKGINSLAGADVLPTSQLFVDELKNQYSTAESLRTLRDKIDEAEKNGDTEKLKLFQEQYKRLKIEFDSSVEANKLRANAFDLLTEAAVNTATLPLTSAAGAIGSQIEKRLVTTLTNVAVNEGVQITAGMTAKEISIQIFKNALGEGAEEIAEEATQRLVEAYFKDNFDPVEFTEGLIESGLFGAALGGSLAGLNIAKAVNELSSAFNSLNLSGREYTGAVGAEPVSFTSVFTRPGETPTERTYTGGGTQRADGENIGAPRIDAPVSGGARDGSILGIPLLNTAVSGEQTNSPAELVTQLMANPAFQALSPAAQQTALQTAINTLNFGNSNTAAGNTSRASSTEPFQFISANNSTNPPNSTASQTPNVTKTRNPDGSYTLSDGRGNAFDLNRPPRENAPPVNSLPPEGASGSDVGSFIGRGNNPDFDQNSGQSGRPTVQNRADNNTFEIPLEAPRAESGKVGASNETSSPRPEANLSGRLDENSTPHDVISRIEQIPLDLRSPALEEYRKRLEKVDNENFDPTDPTMSFKDPFQSLQDLNQRIIDLKNLEKTVKAQINEGNGDISDTPETRLLSQLYTQAGGDVQFNYYMKNLTDYRNQLSAVIEGGVTLQGATNGESFGPLPTDPLKGKGATIARAELLKPDPNTPFGQYIGQLNADPLAPFKTGQSPRETLARLQSIQNSGVTLSADQQRGLEDFKKNLVKIITGDGLPAIVTPVEASKISKMGTQAQAKLEQGNRLNGVGVHNFGNLNDLPSEKQFGATKARADLLYALNPNPNTLFGQYVQTLNNPQTFESPLTKLAQMQKTLDLMQQRPNPNVSPEAWAARQADVQNFIQNLQKIISGEKFYVPEITPPLPSGTTSNRSTDLGALPENNSAAMRGAVISRANLLQPASDSMLGKYLDKINRSADLTKPLPPTDTPERQIKIAEARLARGQDTPEKQAELKTFINQLQQIQSGKGFIDPSFPPSVAGLPQPPRKIGGNNEEINLQDLSQAREAAANNTQVLPLEEPSPSSNTGKKLDATQRNNDATADDIPSDTPKQAKADKATVDNTPEEAFAEPIKKSALGKDKDTSADLLEPASGPSATSSRPDPIKPSSAAKTPEAQLASVKKEIETLQKLKQKLNDRFSESVEKTLRGELPSQEEELFNASLPENQKQLNEALAKLTYQQNSLEIELGLKDPTKTFTNSNAKAVTDPAQSFKSPDEVATTLQKINTIQDPSSTLQAYATELKANPDTVPNPETALKQAQEKRAAIDEVADALNQGKPLTKEQEKLAQEVFGVGKNPNKTVTDLNRYTQELEVLTGNREPAELLTIKPRDPAQGFRREDGSLDQQKVLSVLDGLNNRLDPEDVTPAVIAYKQNLEVGLLKDAYFKSDNYTTVKDQVSIESAKTFEDALRQAEHELGNSERTPELLKQTENRLPTQELQDPATRSAQARQEAANATLSYNVLLVNKENTLYRERLENIKTRDDRLEALQTKRQNGSISKAEIDELTLLKAQEAIVKAQEEKLQNLRDEIRPLKDQLAVQEAALQESAPNEYQQYVDLFSERHQFSDPAKGGDYINATQGIEVNNKYISLAEERLKDPNLTLDEILGLEKDLERFTAQRNSFQKDLDAANAKLENLKQQNPDLYEKIKAYDETKQKLLERNHQVDGISLYLENKSSSFINEQLRNNEKYIANIKENYKNNPNVLAQVKYLEDLPPEEVKKRLDAVEKAGDDARNLAELLDHYTKNPVTESLEAPTSPVTKNNPKVTAADDFESQKAVSSNKEKMTVDDTPDSNTAPSSEKPVPPTKETPPKDPFAKMKEMQARLKNKQQPPQAPDVLPDKKASSAKASNDTSADEIQTNTPKTPPVDASNQKQNNNPILLMMQMLGNESNTLKFSADPSVPAFDANMTQEIEITRNAMTSFQQLYTEFTNGFNNPYISSTEAFLRYVENNATPLGKGEHATAYTINLPGFENIILRFPNGAYGNKSELQFINPELSGLDNIGYPFAKIGNVEFQAKIPGAIPDKPYLPQTLDPDFRAFQSELKKKILTEPGKAQDFIAALERQAQSDPQITQQLEKYKAFENHYAQTLQDIANIPQRAFDDLVHSLNIITQNGYQIDLQHPSNYLIAPQEGTLGIVDLTKGDEASQVTDQQLARLVKLFAGERVEYDVKSFEITGEMTPEMKANIENKAFSLSVLVSDPANQAKVQQALSDLYQKMKLAAEKEGIPWNIDIQQQVSATTFPKSLSPSTEGAGTTSITNEPLNVTTPESSLNTIHIPTDFEPFTLGSKISQETRGQNIEGDGISREHLEIRILSDALSEPARMMAKALDTLYYTPYGATKPYKLNSGESINLYPDDKIRLGLQNGGAEFIVTPNFELVRTNPPEKPTNILSRIIQTANGQLFKIKNAIVNQAGKLVSKTPRENFALSKPQISQEHKEQILRSFIDKGLEMIKNGQYREAVQHFQNKAAEETLRKIGYGHTTHNSTPIRIDQTFPTRSESKKVADQFAENGSFSGKVNVKVPNIHFADPSVPVSLEALTSKKKAEEAELKALEKLSPEQRKVADLLMHEAALINAEEYLHALQELTGKNLTTNIDNAFEAIPDFNKKEMDVAMYLREKGVPLTKSFLHNDRYNRLKFFKQAHDLGLIGKQVDPVDGKTPFLGDKVKDKATSTNTTENPNNNNIKLLMFQLLNAKLNADATNPSSSNGKTTELNRDTTELPLEPTTATNAGTANIINESSPFSGTTTLSNGLKTETNSSFLPPTNTISDVHDNAVIGPEDLEVPVDQTLDYSSANNEMNGFETTPADAETDLPPIQQPYLVFPSDADLEALTLQEKADFIYDTIGLTGTERTLDNAKKKLNELMNEQFPKAEKARENNNIAEAEKADKIGANAFTLLRGIYGFEEALQNVPPILQEGFTLPPEKRPTLPGRAEDVYNALNLKGEERNLETAQKMLHEMMRIQAKQKERAWQKAVLSGNQTAMRELETRPSYPSKLYMEAINIEIELEALPPLLKPGFVLPKGDIKNPDYIYSILDLRGNKHTLSEAEKQLQQIADTEKQRLETARANQNQEVIDEAQKRYDEASAVLKAVKTMQQERIPLRPIKIFDLNTPKGQQLFNESAGRLLTKEERLELFNGPLEAVKIQQESVGDCYLIASIYASLKNPEGRQKIEDMIYLKTYEDGSKIYQVKFYNKDGTVSLVDIEADHPGLQDAGFLANPAIQKILNAGMSFLKSAGLSKYTVYNWQKALYDVAKADRTRVNGPIGVRIIERAYLRLEDPRGKNQDRTLEDKTGGGPPIDALRALTGWSGKRLYSAVQGQQDTPSFANNMKNHPNGYKTYQEAEAFLKQMADNPEMYVASIVTPSMKSGGYTKRYGYLTREQYARLSNNGKEDIETYADPNFRFVNQHAYTLEKVTKEFGQYYVEIHNPHGKADKIPLEQALEIFNLIDYVKKP